MVTNHECCKENSCLECLKRNRYELENVDKYMEDGAVFEYNPSVGGGIKPNVLTVVHKNGDVKVIDQTGTEDILCEVLGDDNGYFKFVSSKTNN